MVIGIEPRWAILLSVFGVCFGLAKFALRDSVADSIRDKFAIVWIYLDDAIKYNLYQIRMNSKVQWSLWLVALIVINAIMLSGDPQRMIKFLRYAIDYSSALPRNLNNGDYLSVYVFALFPMLIMYRLVKDRLQLYIKNSMGKKNVVDILISLMAPYFMYLPIMYCVFKLDGDRFNFILVSYFIIYFLLLAIGAAVIGLILTYIILKSILILIARVLLRLVELKDGPAYFIAVACAVVGIGAIALAK